MNRPNLTLMQHYGTAGVFKEKTAGSTPFAARVAAAVFAGRMAAEAGAEMSLQNMEAHQLNQQFRLLEERNMAPAIANLQHTRAPMFVPAGSDIPVGWDEGMVRLASIARACGTEMAKAAFGLPGVTSTPMHAPLGPMKTQVSGAAAKSGLPGVTSTPMHAPLGPAQTQASAGGARPTPPAATTVVSPPPSAAAPAAAPAGPKPGLMEGMLGKNWKAKALGYGALAGGGYLALKGLNAGLGALSRPAPPQSWGAGYQVPMGVNQYGYPQAGTPLMG